MVKNSHYHKYTHLLRVCRLWRNPIHKSSVCHLGDDFTAGRHTSKHHDTLIKYTFYSSIMLFNYTLKYWLWGIFFPGDYSFFFLDKSICTIATINQTVHYHFCFRNISGGSWAFNQILWNFLPLQGFFQDTEKWY